MLQIYNTLGRKREEFNPIREGIVSFYQCGPTVYSRQHIGNLSSAVRGDLIRRSFEFLDYGQVAYTRNITDVGHLTGENLGDADSGVDKLAKGAKAEGSTPEAVAKKYTDAYHADVAALNVMDPTYETIATEYIETMAEMVQELLDKGFAYVTQKAIYFDVSKKENYTQLSGQKLEENRVGAGHGSVDDTSEKRNPADFAIWFFKTGEHEHALQTWEYKFENIEQPILEGFPGWHIECSAMAKDTLGKTIDVHMGGIEHIPVHHTNEIAQSESANGQTFVNYWLHHEMLLIDGGKMSKSLGNVYSIDDLSEKGFEPLDFRYFLLGAHYRSKQNFTWESLGAASTAYSKLVSKVANIKENIDPNDVLLKSELIENEFYVSFKNALEDDFNIPAGLAVVWDLIKSDEQPNIIYSLLLSFDTVLGLNLDKIDQNDTKKIPKEAEALLKKREEARAEQNWDLADSLRDRLKNEFDIEPNDSKL